MVDRIEVELDALHSELFVRYHDPVPDLVRIRHLWRGVDFLEAKRRHPSRGVVPVHSGG